VFELPVNKVRCFSRLIISKVKKGSMTEENILTPTQSGVSYDHVTRMMTVKFNFVLGSYII